MEGAEGKRYWAEEILGKRYRGLINGGAGDPKSLLGQGNMEDLRKQQCRVGPATHPREKCRKD